jgi:hypothetical protein
MRGAFAKGAFLRRLRSSVGICVIVFGTYVLAQGPHFGKLAYYSKKKHQEQQLGSVDSVSAPPTVSDAGPVVDPVVSAIAKAGFDTTSKAKRPAQDSILTISLDHQEYFTPEYLSKSAFLWFDRDAKGLISPGNGYIQKSGPVGGFKKYDKESYQQFDNIDITVFGTNAYSIGDTVDVFHCERLVKFMGKTANLVRRVAKAKIMSKHNDRLIAVIFKMWDIVSGGDRIDKAFPLQGKEIDTIEQPQGPLCGSVFERVEQTESPYLFQSFIFNRGAKDGVLFGDLFYVYSRQGPDMTSRPSLLACAINIGEQSSTLAIEKMFTNSLSPGDSVVLVRHIRFK